MFENINFFKTNVQNNAENTCRWFRWPFYVEVNTAVDFGNNLLKNGISISPSFD